jgi:hypothetical protein
MMQNCAHSRQAPPPFFERDLNESANSFDTTMSHSAASICPSSFRAESTQSLHLVSRTNGDSHVSRTHLCRQDGRGLPRESAQQVGFIHFCVNARPCLVVAGFPRASALHSGLLRFCLNPRLCLAVAGYPHTSAQDPRLDRFCVNARLCLEPFEKFDPGPPFAPRSGASINRGTDPDPKSTVQNPGTTET